MKLPNNREIESKLAISCYQMKLQDPELGYIKLSFWSKGSHGKPQTTQTVAKTMEFSSQTNSKATLLKTAIT